ncbi:NYN domain-containing protein [bacterium]|nr:NYN domain-containing protein [bacterium]
MLDGGFLTKKLQQRLRRYPLASDVDQECQRILGLSALADTTLLRIYYYDAPPLQKVISNPVDGFEKDLGRTQRARESRALQEGLELLPNFAVRRGELLFQGWKLGDAATRQIQTTPRPPGAKDFVPDIKQKGVDLRMGLDIAWLALKRLVDIIVVVTGDADLVPSLKLARKEGVRVYLEHLGHSVSRDLKVHVDLVL